MGSHGELPSLEPPWDPTIWDGRRKWSQQWCRRKGMVPDDIKGMKGNDGGNDIKGNGNDKSAVDEPNILKDLAAKEKSKGKRKSKGNGNGRAKWSNPERAALAYAEKADAVR